MACGCGKTASEQYKVQAADGIVKKFDTRAEAEQYAIKNGGGMVTRA